jgi:hypothetical protein
MIHVNEIRTTKETEDFFRELTSLLRKHNTIIYHTEHHIKFSRNDNKLDFAQGFCVNGITTIK